MKDEILSIGDSHLIPFLSRFDFIKIHSNSLQIKSSFQEPCPSKSIKIFNKLDLN